jgi:hypothetical protein
MQRAINRGTTFFIYWHSCLVYFSQFYNVNDSETTYCYFSCLVQKLPSTSLSLDYLAAGEQSSLKSEQCVLLFLITFFLIKFDNKLQNILALKLLFVKLFTFLKVNFLHYLSRLYFMLCIMAHNYSLIFFHIFL